MLNNAPIEFLDISFSDYSLDEILEKLSQGIFDNKIIVTPNVDHIVRYHNNKKFKDAYSLCDIYLNDSKVLELLSFYTKKKLNHTTPGSDITESLFRKRTSFSDYQYVAIGSETHDIDAISSLYSTNITHINPSYGFIHKEEEVESIVQLCKKLPKSIYFLAVGSPQQELLAIRLKQAGVQGIFLCIGASLLFLSGSEKRAPMVVRNYRLEWLYRFYKSPKRLFNRYFVNGPKIVSILHRFRKNDR